MARITTRIAARYGCLIAAGGCGCLVLSKYYRIILQQHSVLPDHIPQGYERVRGVLSGKDSRFWGMKW